MVRAIQSLVHERKRCDDTQRFRSSSGVKEQTAGIDFRIVGMNQQSFSWR